MVYLTYNDQPSGIYSSQVIDVVKYLRQMEGNDNVRLFALISVRGFSANKKKIIAQLPGSRVWPMVPKPALWRFNYTLLRFAFLFSKADTIMARGPFAAALALRIRKNGLARKVIFDARGAYSAELNEYDVVQSEAVKKEIAALEKKVLEGADLRLAVSEALVKYWKETYNYNSPAHVVIPCTLNSDFIFAFPPAAELEKLRKKAGYSSNDIVLVYSGSSAGWQSFGLVEQHVLRLMRSDARVKLLMLTDKVDKDSPLFRELGARVATAWVQPHEVKQLLLVADYGILYREQTVTNRVASPVKFAEYLSCGLRVIISPNLGDYSELVAANDLGTADFPPALAPVSYEQKKRANAFALGHFVKDRYRTSYQTLLDC